MQTCLIQRSFVRKAGILIASDYLGVAASSHLATKSHKAIMNEMLPRGSHCSMFASQE